MYLICGNTLNGIKYLPGKLRTNLALAKCTSDIFCPR